MVGIHEGAMHTLMPTRLPDGGKDDLGGGRRKKRGREEASSQAVAQNLDRGEEERRIGQDEKNGSDRLRRGNRNPRFEKGLSAERPQDLP